MGIKHNKLNMIETSMHYKGIMMLLVGLLVCFGVFSLINISKNEFPDFTIRQGLVVAVYPGATSQQVEEQVAKPLESFLWGFKEIKKAKTYSESKDGACYVFVELNDDVTDKDEFWSKFKIKLQQFKSSLPQGVLALIANDDFGNTSAMLITLESNVRSYRELHNYMTDLEDRLRTIPELANLSVTGEQKEQIGVYIDRDRLSEYGISSASLLASLQSQGMTVMSGSVDDQSTVRPVHLVSRINTEADVANQVIYSDPTGKAVRLRDVATVRREYPDADQYVSNNGRKCIVLSIEMRSGNNIVQFGRDVKAKINDFKQTLPSDVTIYPITDQSNVVNSSIMDFLQELLIAVISVIVVIMLLRPLRVASVSAATIPITIFITLGIFYAFGVELNTVTLAALIVALGMIVDDSIVIIDCYIENIDKGMSRWHASASAAGEFFKSIITATLCISVTFFPLLFTLKGMFFDFVKWFPLGVSIVLFTSLFVAVLVVPYVQYVFIRKGVKPDPSKPHRRSLLDIIQGVYNRVITVCFAHPFITLGIGIGSVALGAFLFTVVPQKLMPRAARNQFAVEVYLPEGSAIERTRVVADSLRNMMRRDSRVANVTTFYGCSSPRFQTAYAPQLGGTNFAQFIVNTTGNEATEQLVAEFTPRFTGYFSDAMVRVKQLDYSDAVSPIEVRFTGDNLDSLHAVSERAMAIMRADSNLVLVRSNFNGSLPGLKVALDADESSRLGLSKSAVAANLAMRFGSGVPLTTVWEGDYPVGVVLKDSHAGLQTPDDLANSTVSGLYPGVSVPLRQVSAISPDWNLGMIVRRNGVRTVSVFAEPQHGLNLNEVTDATLAELKSRMHLPAGVQMVVGGQRERDLETEPQIYSGLVISIFVIFIIMLFHLRDIRMSLLIICSLTFSLLGAALGLIIMGQDMSMTGILGIISLMGIIARNGIIMVDYAEELRVKFRLSAKHAAFQAAQRRMRPIFLTCAAASMGVVPMVIENSPMWGPMGVVVCFGTVVSMLFIVTMIPVGYWLIYRLEDHKRILKNEKARSQQMLQKVQQHR